jgi:histidyl-tRNA synthetase
LAGELRAQGLDVILAEPEKLARQFKYADRLGLRKALVLGPDELTAGKVVVKDLKTFAQTAVDRDALIGELRSY